MFNYFAYGSVLSLAHAREWCSSHGMEVEPFLAGRPALLSGYRLVFDVPSRFWSGRVANLEADAARQVEGVLFELEDDARLAVLRKEGVATGLYRELLLPVTVDGRTVTASVFVAEEDRRVGPGPASSRYLQALREGAVERGLSAAWRAELEQHAADEPRPPPPGITLGVKR